MVHRANSPLGGRIAEDQRTGARPPRLAAATALPDRHRGEPGALERPCCGMQP